MIIKVDKTNLFQAAVIHASSWKESHCFFCAPDFVEMHTAERQQEYILPDKQKMGYGTKLLQFAVEQCTDTPTLWILENNTHAKRLYHKMGFQETGRIHAIADGLDEIELSYV